ncbi:B12-binding domain-containing protein [Streptomyces sp. NPDC048507]|uniref:cobalamin B12-binding domain-containing protein n=1 Tax=Streptomyces sp. NPDC048507 TaxID=3365560 RepID=UPI003723A536
MSPSLPYPEGGAAAREAGPREWADRLWDAVLAQDETAARDTVIAAAESVGTESALLDVIGAVQRRVGTEWAADRISVAQEHAATTINDRSVSALVRHPRAQPPPGPRAGHVTVACVDGEWHGLPARLLTEVLRLRGWEVDHLGTLVPPPRLVAHLHRTGPAAVALSGSLATRLPAAHATIAACRAAGVPVFAGGPAFGRDGRYARMLGADAWAPDARSAADRLAAGPLPRPRPGDEPADDLPHLRDQEFTLVARSAPQLVKAVVTGLTELLPALRAYTEWQLQQTAQDIAHVVEFLGAALYVDDAELFTGFMGWTTDILTARHVPANVLLPTLDLLGAELGDFPRATRLIRQGARELTDRTAPDPPAPEAHR